MNGSNKELSFMQAHEHWHMPDWWYRERRPPNDNAYFENMSRVIFQAGLNWHVIDLKWDATKEAFADFDVNTVSGFTDIDVQRLMKNEGIIRNRAKIQATIYNAKGFQALAQQFGSFSAYLDSLDKSSNYSKVVKDLAGKFKRVGPSSARLFLYSVDEGINPWEPQKQSFNPKLLLKKEATQNVKDPSAHIYHWKSARCFLQTKNKTASAKPWSDGLG
jgi:3-methyladenine DNA glycosylase Tag